MGGKATVAGRELRDGTDVGGGGPVRIGDLELDRDSMIVRGPAGSTPLPLQEYVLLRMLAEHDGQVLSRRYLLDHAWEPGYDDENKTLQVHMYRLRRRLRSLGGSCPLRTVRGVGYILDRARD